MAITNRMNNDWTKLIVPVRSSSQAVGRSIVTTTIVMGEISKREGKKSFPVAILTHQH
jgi:hypothetical protein